MSKPHITLLAAGKGTRLGELTKDTPKPMLDIHGKPFLVRLIDYYRAQGFKTFTICVEYLRDVIINYDFGPGVSFLLANPYETVRTLPSSWFINADTWLTTPLPEIDGDKSYVLTYKDIDAGAQYFSRQHKGLVNIIPCGKFYDIGTPKGLEDFREYWFKKEYSNDYYKDPA